MNKIFLQKKRVNNTVTLPVTGTSYSSLHHFFKSTEFQSLIASLILYPSRKAYKSDIFIVFSSSFVDLFDLVEEVGQNFYEFMQISQVMIFFIQGSTLLPLNPDPFGWGWWILVRIQYSLP